MNRKIQAFTLSEMIVVLIITTIVVGLAFSTLGLVQKQMIAIKGNYQNNLEINKLEAALWLDFNRYRNVSYDDVNQQLVLKSDRDSVSYKISENRILRDLDTFNIKVKTKTLFFDGELTDEGNVDAVKLVLSESYLNKELFVFKRNDATNYMD